LLFIVTACCLFAVAEKVAAGQGDRGKLFGFAEALFAEGDYYRAITEYKRFKYFHPVDILVEKSDFRIGECYFKAGRWAEAIESLEAFVQQYPEGALYADALYLKGRAEKELKRFSDALATLDQLSRTRDRHYHDKALYERALVLLAQQDWQKARDAFAMMPRESPLYPSADIYSQGLGRMDDLPRKSPETAGILATVLPGAGHLYTDRPGDALVSFLLNGAFIWGAVELFRNGNNVAGGIVAFFELGWYSGNIYSAVSSAHKYNQRVRTEYINDLKEKGGLSLYRDREGAHYIMYSMMF
jgi:outer membrane protein assembly factor BamD (BamD/ComL family)